MITLPRSSAIEIIVLFDEAWIWATPLLNERRFFFAIGIYPYFDSIFLFATVFLGPLRVRALDFVLCPRTGSPRRCLKPRHALISIKRLMLNATSRRKSPSSTY